MPDRTITAPAGFNESPAPQALTSMDGRLLAVNRALCALMGFQDVELVGNRVLDFVHPADRSAVRAAGTELREGDGAVTLEGRFQRSSDGMSALRLYATCVPGPPGNPAYVHVFVTDISREEHLYSSAERSAALATELANGLSEAVVEAAYDGTVRWSSATAKRLLGVHVNELYAGLLSIAHPEDVSELRTALGTVLASDSTTDVVRTTFRAEREGTITHLEVRLSRGRSFPTPTLLLHLRDRTDLVVAETLLEAELRVLRQIAARRPIEETLPGVVAMVESISPDARGSVLTLEAPARRLRVAAAPSLPESYVHALNGLAAGPRGGPCGSAAHHGRTVVVHDIRTHPDWEGWRNLALGAGIMSSCSAPILGPDERVLGVLCVVHRSPRRPTDQEWWLIHRAAVLAAVALTSAAPMASRHRRSAALLAGLTTRERSVLELLARGFTNGEIAAQLSVSVRTVEAHRGRLNQKLDASTRADLVSIALEAGLLRP